MATFDMCVLRLCFGDIKNKGESRADALSTGVQLHVGWFWGPVKWDTLINANFKWETGFGLLSPSWVDPHGPTRFFLRFKRFIFEKLIFFRLWHKKVSTSNFLDHKSDKRSHSSWLIFLWVLHFRSQSGLKSSIFIDFQSKFPQDSLLKKIFRLRRAEIGDWKRAPRYPRSRPAHSPWYWGGWIDGRQQWNPEPIGADKDVLSAGDWNQISQRAVPKMLRGRESHRWAD